MSKEEKYRVSDRYAHKELIVWVTPSGKRVNLTGKDYQAKRAATPDNPITDVKIQGATQEEMETYFNLGIQDIIVKS